MANTPKDDEDPPIVVIINGIKKFLAENPKTVTFVCGILTGIILVWVL